MKYELWGIHGHQGGGDDEDLVAIFSSEEKAKAYVKASLLKKQRYYSWKEFRKKSLLSFYDNYNIREVREYDDYPYDPEL